MLRPFGRQFIVWVLILLSEVPEEALGVTKITYKVTEDYIFETNLRPDILYNPKYLQLAKHIDLTSLTKSVEAIKTLLIAFNTSCTRQKLRTSSSNARTRMVEIPGESLSVTDGIHLCKNLGNGYKLLELQHKEDVARFLSETADGRFSIPAAIYYDIRIHKFVYFSSNSPVTKESAIYRFEDGTTIGSYDYWDSYVDYFGQYVVDNSQVYLSVVPSRTTYDKVFCMTTESPEQGTEIAKSCQQDLRFVTDISQTTTNRAERLNTFLADTWQIHKRENQRVRGKRGIATAAVLSAAIGGIAGVVTNKLISAATPDDNLSQAISETEEALKSLKERTNLLDINQKRMMILLEENQKQLNDLTWRRSEQSWRRQIHAQINSLLIHVKDHVDYLLYLLSSRENTGAYNLAFDDREREVVIQRITNGSQPWRGAQISALRYRFKMLGPRDICLVIDVPLQPPLQSKAVVRPFLFPSTEGSTLVSPKGTSLPFIQFHGSFYVKLDFPTFNTCLEKGFCSGPWAPELADGGMDCSMSQYFDNAKTKCVRQHMDDKRYLLYAGSTLFYTTLDPVQVRFTCKKKEKDVIKDIMGRGVLSIPLPIMSLMTSFSFFLHVNRT